MEISKLKKLTATESAVLIYLMNKGICKARAISRNLEIDIYNLYKVLNSLEEKGFVTKSEQAFKAREDLTLK